VIAVGAQDVSSSEGFIANSSPMGWKHGLVSLSISALVALYFITAAWGHGALDDDYVASPVSGLHHRSQESFGIGVGEVAQ